MDEPTSRPSFRVTVAPLGDSFDAPADQSLLLAALDAGLRLPHSCRNGTCRACIAHLREGRIDYRIDWPGLSREEKDEGWILPCVACARSDLTLDAPGAVRLTPAPRPAALIAPLPPGDVSADTPATTTQK